MSDYDLIIKSRSLEGEPITLAVVDGVIEAIGPNVSGTGREEIDASEMWLYPGWIDAHVHFNEPGRTEWEGIASGSRALAAGGGTTFIDMPLNSSPPVVTAKALMEKRRIGEEKSCLDFALWGGLVPASLEEINAMADGGAVGFKAFMCPSGLDEFPASDPETLRRGMQLAAARRLPVAVHAEIEPKTPPNGFDMTAWLESRPIKAELEAIRIALDLAGETGCPLHIVHISNPEGIDLVTEAKKAGIDVTTETCPHYLLLNTDDAVAIGTFAKCAPPLRDKETVEGLRERVRTGNVDTIGSDHSPASPELKQGENLLACWGGIAGIQDGLALLMDEKLAEPDLLSSNVASRFRLPKKGGLQRGNDADFILVKEDPHVIDTNETLTRHPHSPFTGRQVRHRVAATYLRGEKVSEKTRGQFLQPPQN